MRTQDSVAEFLEFTKLGMSRYLAGFDDTNHTRQAPGLPNHVAWNLGHLALTMHRACELVDKVPPPASDFVVGSKQGDASRFGTEGVSFASVPTADASVYPNLARCVTIYNAAVDRTASFARGCSDAQLMQTVPWGPSTTTVHLLLSRMGFHNGMHVGQVADLRRALGFKSIFS